MKTYFIFSFLFSIVITQSCNTGDRQIQQRCFNLVNQQLSWSEARNYCHNRNSYLATVPEQTTDSYLASYARTSFNINEGNFWIGLYRNSTTSKWQWDDGTPFAWNNFENPNLNYVAESIKNGKWNTFVAETRLNFVCSYYPNGAPTEPVTGSTEPPHWTTTESETVTPTVTPTCSRTSPYTLFFAYSTDLDPNIFDNLSQNFYNRKYVNVAYFANIRFDLKKAEEVEFHTDLNSCKNSVISHWPDPSLGFSNRSAGSDVLRVIETFLDNDHVALCGAYIEILLKRYPNEKEIDQLVARLRQIHASVTVVIPTNSSGGLYPETMYRLATKTNGLGFFTLDDEYQHTNSILTYFGDYPWLVYSENVIVSQSGSMNLPRMSIPATNIYFFGTTTEDSGVVSFASTTFQINNMILTKPGVSFKLFETYDEVWDTNILWTSKTIESGNYDVTFYYNYSDSREQTLQIRVYSMIPTNYWIPYAD